MINPSLLPQQRHQGLSSSSDDDDDDDGDDHDDQVSVDRRMKLEQRFEKKFKQRYKTLHDIYERRLGSLLEQIPALRVSLEKDPALHTLSHDADTRGYVSERVNEIIDSHVSDEKERFIQTLAHECSRKDMKLTELRIAKQELVMQSKHLREFAQNQSSLKHKLESELQELEYQLRDSQRTVANQAQALKKLEHQVQRQDRAFQSKDQDRAEQHERVSREMEHLKAQSKELERVNHELVSQIEAYQGQEQHDREKRKQRRVDFDELEQRQAQLQQQLGQMGQELEQSNHQVVQLEQQNQKYKRKYEHLGNQVELLIEESAQEQHHEIQDLLQHKKTLEHEIHMEREKVAKHQQDSVTREKQYQVHEQEWDRKWLELEGAYADLKVIFADEKSKHHEKMKESQSELAQMIQESKIALEQEFHEKEALRDEISRQQHVYELKLNQLEMKVQWFMNTEAEDLSVSQISSPPSLSTSGTKKSTKRNAKKSQQRKQKNNYENGRHNLDFESDGDDHTEADYDEPHHATQSNVGKDEMISLLEHFQKLKQERQKWEQRYEIQEKDWQEQKGKLETQSQQKQIEFNSERQSRESQHREWKTREAQMEFQLQELGDENQNLRQSIHEWTQKTEELEVHMSRWKSEFHKEQDKKIELIQQLEEANVNLTQLRNLVEQSAVEISTVCSREMEMKQLVEKCRQEIRDREEHLDQCSNQEQKDRAQIKQMQDQLAMQIKACEATSEKLCSTQTQNQHLHYQVAELQEQLNAQADQMNQCKSEWKVQQVQHQQQLEKGAAQRIVLKTRQDAAMSLQHQSKSEFKRVSQIKGDFQVLQRFCQQQMSTFAHELTMESHELLWKLQYRFQQQAHDQQQLKNDESLNFQTQMEKMKLESKAQLKKVHKQLSVAQQELEEVRSKIMSQTSRVKQLEKELCASQDLGQERLEQSKQWQDQCQQLKLTQERQWQHAIDFFSSILGFIHQRLVCQLSFRTTDLEQEVHECKGDGGKLNENIVMIIQRHWKDCIGTEQHGKNQHEMGITTLSLQQQFQHWFERHWTLNLQLQEQKNKENFTQEQQQLKQYHLNQTKQLEEQYNHQIQKERNAQAQEYQQHIQALEQQYQVKSHGLNQNHEKDIERLKVDSRVELETLQQQMENKIQQQLQDLQDEQSGETARIQEESQVIRIRLGIAVTTHLLT